MSLFKKSISYRTIHIQYIYPYFKTVDGEYHTGYTHAMDKFSLNCECGEYRMINVTSDKYLKDSENVQYPLANIISVDWKISKEKEYKIEDRSTNPREFNIPKIYYSNKDIELLDSINIE